MIGPSLMSLTTYIDDFPKQHVLVVGDLILDHYIHGSVSRTSPEAPVPIINHGEEEWLPGGAANVAANICSLGAKASLIGLCGKDPIGEHLESLLTAEEGLKPVLIKDSSRPTTLKTRYVSQGQQMLRHDREVSSPASESVESKLLKAIEKTIKKCSGVILSDYGKGTLTDRVLKETIRLAKEHNLKVLVDPKGNNYRKYEGATLLTPNQKEASEASGLRIDSDDSTAKAAAIIQKTVKGEVVVITRGPAGISVFPRKGKATHIPARAREVFDVTGAGDTVISTMGLSLFSGATFPEAATLGNHGAGIVVGIAGVACVTAAGLRAACMEEDDISAFKYVPPSELKRVTRSLKKNGRRIAFTNGFFDLLHHGHIRLLEEAKKMGDCLIVALNSDESTRRLKGAPRPILSLNERIKLLASFPAVDYITSFDEDTPQKLLKLLQPDILVKGGEKGAEISDIVGYEIVEAYGGKVHYVWLKDDEPRIRKILERAMPSTESDESN